MTHCKYSLVIPCYNEEGNIENLTTKCKQLFSNSIYEIIFVDNGSSDETHNLLYKKTRNISNFRIHRIKNNIGIGHGIYEGLKLANGSILGWTHGDLQTDPSDVLKAFNIAAKHSGKVFIKGRRSYKNRSFFESFFTIGMSFFETALHFKYFWDINAQPNIFSKDFFLSLKNPPGNYLIDLFFYNHAISSNVKIVRFKVQFKKRYSGNSKWNTSISKKFMFILNTVIYSLKLRFLKII